MSLPPKPDTLWPMAVLHVDGDAFFASVIQAVRPELKGKPIATGKERGVAIAVSYEAKKLGVKRCMTGWEIKKMCPECILVTSEFKLYHIFSKRMFEILRTFSPIVEEYSIDEGFVDITHLPLLYNTDYHTIGKMIKQKIEESLGITVSVGVSVNKSLAKIGSNYNKPSGLVVIDPSSTPSYLKKLPVNNVWGIGSNITRRLQEIGILTAYDYITHTEAFIKKHLSKPYLEIWRELQGMYVYKIDPEAKTEYKSISKIQTFGRPTGDSDVLWARLMDRVEEAFEKARKFNYNVGKVVLFLKKQDFTYEATELKISEKTAFPYLIKPQLKEGFANVFKRGTVYRATGCVLSEFEECTYHQDSLFSNTKVVENKMKSIYSLYEKGKISFGTSLLDPYHRYKKTKQDRLGLPMLDL